MKRKLLVLLAVAVATCAGQGRRSEEFPTSAGAVRLTPIEHAGFLLQGGGRNIYVDPASGNYEGLPKADLIILTDIHPDHLVPATIDKVKKDSTVFLAPESVAKTIPAAQVMRYGDSRNWEGWTIEAVAAYNIKRGQSPGSVFHERGRGNGYVLGFGGKRFYISGDTEPTPEMAALKNIDVAVICMNVPYTMPPEEAAEAVKSFKPKIAIPYHYRGSDLSVFQKALAGSGIEVRLLDWYPNGQGGGAPGGRGGAPAGGRGANPAQAPSPTPNQAPAPGGGRGGRAQASVAQPGPLILPDRRVTFRLIAPKATAVMLNGELWLDNRSNGSNGSQPMQKDEQGLWSLTVGPLTPGTYSYWFVADGVHLPDPANGLIKPGVRLTESQLEVPGPEGEYQALKNVPHGEVRMIWYHSGSLDKNRRMHIYLPPGYDTGSTRYPVLYLLHGGGDNDDGWISIGRTNLVMDNLLADRKAKPMIVVMPFIFAVPQGSPEYPDNPKLFEKDLFQDIIPYVEKHFRTLRGSANTAIGGLSMPDILTDIAFPHLDKFDYLGFTSNGLSDEKIAGYDKRLPGVLTNPANVKRVKFWIGDGTNAMTFPAASNLAQRMKERGYRTTFYTTDGVHGWPWFRKYVSEFAQTLFK